MKWTRVYFWSSESTSLLFRKMNGVEWLVSCRSRWSVYLSLALCIDLSIRSTERRVQQCISKMLRNCNFLKIAQRDNFCKTLSPLLHVNIQNLNISYCAHNSFAQAWSGVRSNSCGTWVSKIMWAVCLFLFDCKFYFGPEFCLPLILLNYFSSNECWSVPFWLDLIFYFFSLVWYYWFTDFCLCILSGCYISNEGERHVERSRLHHQLPLCGDHWTSAEGLLWCEKLKYS